ncbi:MAG: hypothetical protein NC314_11530 [Roseburia sp.]|nr:hypothetical protein [Roseburia sp.]
MDSIAHMKVTDKFFSQVYFEFTVCGAGRPGIAAEDESFTSEIPYHRFHQWFQRSLFIHVSSRQANSLF